MKKQEIVDIYNVLTSLENDRTNRIAALFIFKNLKSLKNEIMSLQEVAKPSEDFLRFDKKRYDAIAKVSSKDETGNPILETLPDGRRQFKITNSLDRNELQKTLNDLEEEYQEILKEQIEKENKLKSLLEEDVELPKYLVKINVNDIPNMISAKEISIIEQLIEGIE